MISLASQGRRIPSQHRRFGFRRGCRPSGPRAAPRSAILAILSSSVVPFPKMESRALTTEGSKSLSVLKGYIPSGGGSFHENNLFIIFILLLFGIRASVHGCLTFRLRTQHVSSGCLHKKPLFSWLSQQNRDSRLHSTAYSSRTVAPLRYRFGDTPSPS